MKYKSYRKAFLLLASTILIFLMEGQVRIGLSQKLNKQRPGVFLSFKEYVKLNDGTYGARLILHNNTQWSIFFFQLMGQPLEGDIVASYVIEQENGCRDERGATDVVMKTKLAPGKTLRFVVPIEDFQERNDIYVEFHYSWETSFQKELLRNEAVHRAYFPSRNLPSKP